MINTIEDNICDAIETIVDMKLAKLQFNITILAQIVSIRTENNKTIYRCKYEDSLFDAYPLDAEKTYESGSTVYILVPNNSFLSTKFILCVKP